MKINEMKKQWNEILTAEYKVQLNKCVTLKGNPTMILSCYE